jgi:hypothetical protein
MHPESNELASAFWLMSHVSKRKIGDRTFAKVKATASPSWIASLKLLRKEDILAGGKKGGRTSADNKKGIHILSVEERRVNGSKSGKMNAANGVGLHGRSPEKRLADSQKANEAQRAMWARRREAAAALKMRTEPESL